MPALTIDPFASVGFDYHSNGEDYLPQTAFVPARPPGCRARRRRGPARRRRRYRPRRTCAPSSMAAARLSVLPA
ncbi:hypothetical protein RHIZ404_230458 [Rhizobium sp. EC-SD404]|nr:hypothetical protein RHIZ404_230458 [Rhizobium sp. EC-SD404]